MLTPCRESCQRKDIVLFLPALSLTFRHVRNSSASPRGSTRIVYTQCFEWLHAEAMLALYREVFYHFSLSLWFFLVRVCKWAARPALVSRIEHELLKNQIRIWLKMNQLMVTRAFLLSSLPWGCAVELATVISQLPI